MKSDHLTIGKAGKYEMVLSLAEDNKIRKGLNLIRSPPCCTRAPPCCARGRAAAAATKRRQSLILKICAGSQVLMQIPYVLMMLLMLTARSMSNYWGDVRRGHMCSH